MSCAGITARDAIHAHHPFLCTIHSVHVVYELDYFARFSQKSASLVSVRSEEPSCRNFLSFLAFSCPQEIDFTATEHPRLK